MTRVAIVGSRDFTRGALVVQFINTLPRDTVVISGGARGVDALAARVARLRGMAVQEFLPDYEVHGQRAPLVRNEEIAAAADRVVAFWDGVSSGTAHLISCARKLGKPVEVVR